jgi:hypothetical protein
MLLWKDKTTDDTTTTTTTDDDSSGINLTINGPTFDSLKQIGFSIALILGLTIYPLGGILWCLTAFNPEESNEGG